MALSSGWGTTKLTGRMADYTNATKGTILLGRIQAHMIREAAKPSDRRQDIIHPSEMAKTNWCPKATYLRIKKCRDNNDPYLKEAEFIGVQLLNIFDEGHSIHDKWQKRLRDMGLLWGNWQCSSCKSTEKDSFFSGVCSYCDEVETLIYHEVPLRDEQYLIRGHADGAVPSLNALIEIKSVGVGTARIEAPEIYAAHSEGQKIDLQGLWKAIEEPFPSHIRQGQLYMYIAQEMGLPYNKIIFLYESKFNQGAKEFVVDYNYDIVEPLIDYARSIKSALNGGLPNAENCIVCKDKNLNYPFICECTDEPVKCPYGSCKDCERYGTKSSVTVGLESPGQPEPERVDSPRTTRRRASSTPRRIIRSP